MTLAQYASSLLPHRHVRARFAWLMGLSGVLFAVGLSLWIVQGQREQLQSAINDSVRREAAVLGQIIELALADRQSQLQLLASQPELVSGPINPSALRLSLERLRSVHPEFEWLALTDAQGLVITATGTHMERTRQAHAEWFVQGRRAPWIGQPHNAGPLASVLPPDDGGRPLQLVDMAVPVLDYDGQLVGVLTAMLNWRWVRELHADTIRGDPLLRHTLLLDPAGKVVIGPERLLGFQAPPEVLAGLREGAAPLPVQWPDVGRYLTAAAPLRWSTQDVQPAWTMVLRQDPGVVFAQADRLWQRLLLVAVLGSALFMALSWWLAGRVVRPLRVLADTAVALREGRPAVFRLEGQDEIAALSMSLHHLHHDLRLRMSELAAYRDDLEHRIAARTEQLKDALDKAEAANRAKAAFIANMSHEIRTPMNAILGMSYLLQRAHLPREQAERVQTVSQAGEHLLQIINNILDLSKIEAGMFRLQPEDFDLRDLLARTLKLVEPAAQAKGLGLSLHTPGELVASLYGDMTRLAQLLLNLVGNAVKFTDQGEVRVIAETQPMADGRLNLCIEVHDSGPGVPPDQIPRLFNAFVQADDSPTRRHEGTGLGLAITRSLVDLMGGQVGVRNGPDRGAVFWLQVPLAPARGPLTVRPPAPITPAPAPAPGPLALPPHILALQDTEAQALLSARHAGAQVLLAEDNLVNSLLAIELLEMSGLHVVHVTTGQAALDQVRTQAPRLILMDVHMPEMDGLQATRLIRQVPQGQRVPIVAMTASVLHNERSACLDAGMDGHLAKPIDTRTLFQTLLYWLDNGRDDVASVSPHL